jgi:hypothetical protein
MLRIGFSPFDLSQRETSGTEFVNETVGIGSKLIRDLTFWKGKKCSICGDSLDRGGVIDPAGKANQGRGAVLCHTHARQFGISDIPQTAPSLVSPKKAQQESARSKFDKMRQKRPIPQVDDISESPKTPTWWESFMGGFQSGLKGDKMDYETWQSDRMNPKKYRPRKYRDLNWMQRLIGE